MLWQDDIAPYRHASFVLSLRHMDTSPSVTALYLQGFTRRVLLFTKYTILDDDTPSTAEKRGAVLFVRTFGWHTLLVITRFLLPPAVV